MAVINLSSVKHLFAYHWCRKDIVLTYIYPLNVP